MALPLSDSIRREECRIATFHNPKKGEKYYLVLFGPPQGAAEILLVGLMDGVCQMGTELDARDVLPLSGLGLMTYQDSLRKFKIKIPWLEDSFAMNRKYEQTLSRELTVYNEWLRSK